MYYRRVRGKGTKNGLSLEVPTPIRNVYKRHCFFCVCFFWVGGKEFKTAGLVFKRTSSSSLTCINVVVFVGVGKMNVKPHF